MTRAYRQPSHITPKPPTLLEEVVYAFRFLPRVRRWLGGHWERLYDRGYPPHDNGSGWGPWHQVPCRHFGSNVECEDWGPIR